jgi:hypothetical protein
VVSGFGVKSEGFGPIPALITATTGVEERILSGLLRNRTPETGFSRPEVNTVAERRGVRKSLNNVRGSPGEIRARDASVDGCTLGTWVAANSWTDYIVSALLFSRRPQSRYGDASRQVGQSTWESRAAAQRPRGPGGGSATEGSARVWRAGNWEDRRPEAPADGRERVAVRRRST